MKQNEKKVYQILKQLGYNDKQISGIMANIQVQTGGTFDYTTKQIGGNGYGLFQFEFLRPYYNKYIKDLKLQDSPKSQIQFMHSTIRGQNKNIIGQCNANKINNAFKNGISTEIAQTFCTVWQKPGITHLQRRLQAAKNYEKILIPSLPKVKQEKIQVQKKPTQIYSFSTLTSTPNFNFGSSPSSGFGLSNDRRNYGYSFDNGSRFSTGFSSGKPSIQISIPCQII